MQKFGLISVAFMLTGCSLSEIEINKDFIRYSKTNETEIFTDIGENTHGEIQDRRDVIEHCNIEHHGTEFDIDKTASKILAIYCEGFKPLAIRLKKTSFSQYEVLGYWTLDIK